MKRPRYQRKPIAPLERVTRSGDDSPPTLRMVPKHGLLRCEKYLRWVRLQPCSFCGKHGGEAHHYPSKGALGVRDDSLVCSACRDCHHAAQHYRISHEKQAEAVTKTWERCRMYGPPAIVGEMEAKMAERRPK